MPQNYIKHHLDALYKKLEKEIKDKSDTRDDGFTNGSFEYIFEDENYCFTVDWNIDTGGNLEFSALCMMYDGDSIDGGVDYLELEMNVKYEQ